MIPVELRARLRLPAIAAPLFLISGPDLVVEACRSGVIGAFPSLNQRSPEGYRQWLELIRSRLSASDAPFAVQISIHPTNQRLNEDLALTIRFRVPILITTLGITREITDAIHGYGGLVLHDAINIRHAKKSLAANVDGIIAVCAGAGGHAGTYNPFAYLGELRQIMHDKMLILAGCIGDGHALAAANAAGADLAYIGTRFINTHESLAPEHMKQLIIQSDITDIEYSTQVDGIGANWLRQTMPSPRDALAGECFDVSQVLGEPKRWKEILSAGQAVGSIHDIPSARALVARMQSEYREAVLRLASWAPVGGI